MFNPNRPNLIKYFIASAAIIISVCLFSYVYAKTGFSIGSPYGMQLKNTAENLIYGVASTTQLAGNLIKLQTFTSPSTYTDRFLISKNGRISINSSSPNANSSLFIASSTGNAEIDLQSGTQNYWAIYQQYSGTNIGDLQFWNTDTTNILTLTDTTGYIGINTQSPEGRLTVNGDVGIGDPANTVQGSHMLDVASSKGGAGNSAIRALSSAVDAEFGALANRNGVWAAVYGKQGTTAQTAGYFDGSVGINTNTPSSNVKLVVNGNLGATQYCDNNGANCQDLDLFNNCPDTGSYYLVKNSSGGWDCKDARKKYYPLHYFITQNSYNGNLVAAAQAQGSTADNGDEAARYLCMHDPNRIDEIIYFGNFRPGKWGDDGIYYQGDYGSGLGMIDLYTDGSPKFWAKLRSETSDCSNWTTTHSFGYDSDFTAGQKIGEDNIYALVVDCDELRKILCVQQY